MTKTLINVDDTAFNLLNTYFKSKGFRKNGKIWYSRENQVLVLFEYQSSNFRNGFYINIGIYNEELSGKKKPIPKSYDWHLNGRHNDLLPEYKESFFPTAITSDELEKSIDQLTEKIDNVILPFMTDFRNYEKAIHHLRSDLKLMVQNVTTDNLISFLEGKIIRSG